jgi:hypothetical protein
LRHAAERHGFAVVQLPVDRVLLAAGLHRLQRGHVFGHHHGLRAGQSLDLGIAFLVIAMGVRAEEDFDVGKLEAEIARFWITGVPLIGAVDEDVALRRR